MHRILTSSLALTLAGAALLGCDNGTVDVDDPPAAEPGLERLADCGALRAYLGDVMLETALSSRYGGYYGWGVLEDGVDGSDGSDGSDGGPTDYTTTNVQEAGVDEIDLVKTDGTYMYIAEDQALHILSSWPAEDAELLASVDLDGWTRGLFLDGDRVVVFSWVYDEDAGFMDSYYSGTRVQVFDVSDRTAPALERTIDIEGSLADGRMIDGRVYLVMNHYLPLPEELWDLLWDDTLALPEVDWSLSGAALDLDLELKRARAAAILEPYITHLAYTMDLDTMLPEWRDQVEGAAAATPELMHACSDIYRPNEVSQPGMLSVVELDLEDDELSATGVMSDGWTVYASEDNLYVAQPSWWWWWGFGDLDMQTYIHKFVLDPDSEPTYVATGAVDGWVYDQFSMSEWDDHLRVTTTDIDWWWWTGDSEGGNNVFVLEDDGLGSLDVVGEVTGIAPGEQIYATRMMEDKGYMVTYEQVDPLFTLDLSDHTNPRVVGELEIPGYSAYLHPLDADHLLAVGMAGDADGNLSGVAVNVFDVSDFAAPELVHQYVLESDEWSWSESLWDHHAFTFHRGVLSVPATTYSYDDVTGDWDYFSGLYTMSVDPTAGISLLGKVDHRDLVTDSECVYSMWYDGYEDDVCDDWAWYASVRRSVYIEDNMFSISDYGVKVNDLNDPSVEHARVLFYPAVLD